MKTQNLKELILLGISTILLVGLVVFFVYMVKTEDSKEKMMNMLSTLKMDVEEQKETKTELNLDILKKEKFKELEVYPTPDLEFKEGKRNPFQSSNKENEE